MSNGKTFFVKQRTDLTGPGISDDRSHNSHKKDLKDRLGENKEQDRKDDRTKNVCNHLPDVPLPGILYLPVNRCTDPGEDHRGDKEKGHGNAPAEAKDAEQVHPKKICSKGALFCEDIGPIQQYGNQHHCKYQKSDPCCIEALFM